MAFGTRKPSTAPAQQVTEKDATTATPRLPRRRSLRDFWNANIAKIPRRVKKPGKRNTRVPTPGSRRTSQILIVPTHEEKDQLLRYDSTDSAHEIVDPIKDTDEKRQPLVTADPTNKAPSVHTVEQSKSLTESDLRSLFSGAPKFCVPESQIGHTPKVMYYGADLSKLEGGGDHTKFSHSTFAAATLGLHKSEAEIEDASAKNSRPTSRGQGRDPLEVPNMNSLPGLEPGTIGFQYFLQLPIADSKLVDDHPDTGAKRKMLHSEPEKLGVQHVNVERMIDRLVELGDLEQQRKKPGALIPKINEQKAGEMYGELFAKFLFPPKFDKSTIRNGTGLKVQIEALIKVLHEPGLWHDFSFVEWRIRIGQLLWTTDELASSQVQGLASERDTLLLQITLASELLVRLNSMDSVPAEDAAEVGSLLTPKTVWDLVLAGRFLDNVRIAPRVTSSSKKDNRASLFSIMSFVTAYESSDDTVTQVVPILYPRHEQRQLEGLQRFCEGIDWPHTDEITTKMTERVKQLAAQAYTAFATPIGTPGLTSTKQNGYFGDTKRPQVGRVPTAQSMQLLPATAYDSDAFDAGGWLSRSWLTGLVMPGEPISHFLISTLLENSTQALDCLGDSADLYGGFCYRGRSYWSKSSVVGRVVAATTDARDCMGWISAPGLSSATQADGWINVESTDVHMSAERITNSDLLSQDSLPFPTGETAQLRKDDFSWPVDAERPQPPTFQYQGLSFRSTETNYELSKDQTESGENGIAAAATLTALTTFSSPSKIVKFTVPLSFDVYFVSSYPCHPVTHSARSSLPGTPIMKKELPHPPCHPLHNSYDYEIVPATTLLTREADRLRKTPQDVSTAGTVIRKQKIIVLDARGNKDLEVLSRAWCAKTGEHALVGRVGRSCLACCVREASGLGMRIVIRV